MVAAAAVCQMAQELDEAWCQRPSTDAACCTYLALHILCHNDQRALDLHNLLKDWQDGGKTAEEQGQEEMSPLPPPLQQNAHVNLLPFSRHADT